MPIYGGAEFLDDLLEAIKDQSLMPDEVIFVISKGKDSQIIENKLKNQDSLNISYKLIDLSYPGEARNIGVGSSKNAWIAFLDLRTLPISNWLESIYKATDSGKNQFVGAVRTCEANTPYKKMLQALTTGNVAEKCLSGSIVSRNLFNASKGFLPNVRAGEDLDWLNRISNIDEILWLEKPMIKYSGLPSNLIQTIKKWFWYSFENSKVDILRTQKTLYVLLAVILLGIFAYNWNFVFTNDQWDESPYFVPNLNKILWSVSLLLYILYRGLIRPFTLQENLHYLLPFRWMLIGCLGVIIDITKAPGRLFGFMQYIRKKVE